MTKLNRKHRDSLFCYIYGREENKEWTLSLFNSINDTNYEDPNEIIINTIEDILFIGRQNDVSFLINDTINLYEHQSTYNPNMPIRQLMYASQLYSKYVFDNDLNLYSEKQIILPIPKFITFYNGEKDREDMILKLSDAFPKDSHLDGDIEVLVKMLNINQGHNKELLAKCKTLSQYSQFVDTIRKLSKVMDIEAAIEHALNEMSDETSLKQFLLAHRAEVYKMVINEYDEEKTKDQFRREFIAEGKAEGIAEGKDEAYVQYDKLISQLLKDNRLDDLKKASEDKEYRSLLFKEYNIEG
ncbi:hypothetical protein SAMN02910369_00708 [Lachnospiraceae bacterium NE2001]|nr:hypothetical protein SAMN02910369_00708 [Lachnospiraceae bacterium NE2001]